MLTALLAVSPYIIEEMSTAVKSNAAVVIAFVLGHALAWAVYLPVVIGFVLWPYFHGGRGEDLRVLITVFIPVVLTGLALLTVATRGGERWGIWSARWALATLLGGLGLFAVSQVYLPVPVKLVVGALIGWLAVTPAAGLGKTAQGFSLWATVVLLLGFCGLAAFSVGLLYLPAWLALLAAAVLRTVHFTRRLDMTEPASSRAEGARPPC